MYTANWSATSSGGLIFLLDQSESMEEPFGQSQTGGGQRKCDAVCTVFNGFLDELVSINTVIGANSIAEARPRADIAVIGYHGSQVTTALSGPLAGRDFVTLPELQRNPIRVESRTKKELDGIGNLVEMQVPFPIWVEPVSSGGTPMLKAFQRARDLAKAWAAAHPDSYPPVIINLTDGAATDSRVAGDLEKAAGEICSICTTDGNALLFTVHITSHKAYPVEYPATQDELPNDLFAPRLFEVTSTIPDEARTILDTLLGHAVPPGAKGLIFNGDAASVLLMFKFASAPAIPQVDPNR
jgi:hypothetical protein